MFEISVVASNRYAACALGNALEQYATWRTGCSAKEPRAERAYARIVMLAGSLLGHFGIRGLRRSE